MMHARTLAERRLQARMIRCACAGRLQEARRELGFALEVERVDTLRLVRALQYSNVRWF